MKRSDISIKELAAIDSNGPLIQRFESCDHTQDGCLPCPAGTKERKESPTLHEQRHIINGQRGAMMLHQRHDVDASWLFNHPDPFG
jgi:hypothetical protein